MFTCVALYKLAILLAKLSYVYGSSGKESISSTGVYSYRLTLAECNSYNRLELLYYITIHSMQVVLCDDMKRVLVDGRD